MRGGCDAFTTALTRGRNQPTHSGDLIWGTPADSLGMELETDETGPEPATDERLLEWRYDELRRAGFDNDLAFIVAVRYDVDLHVALELLARGCPPGTAARILL